MVDFLVAIDLSRLWRAFLNSWGKWKFGNNHHCETEAKQSRRVRKLSQKKSKTNKILDCFGQSPRNDVQQESLNPAGIPLLREINAFVIASRRRSNPEEREAINTNNSTGLLRAESSQGRAASVFNSVRLPPIK